jgi:hypothetical protein
VVLLALVLWINVPMALFSMLITVWKVPKDDTKGERLHNDYPGMVVLTAGLVALMIVHALPLRTAAEVDDLAGIVDRAYQFGLSVVLWISAVLVLIALLLVLRFVRPSSTPSVPAAAHAGESPHR